MCGICGQYSFQTNLPVDPQAIRRMMDTIIHRGPDDDGIYVSGSLGLGFRRLAILDLSPAGHQPMADEQEKYWIVFNGEIYNFQDLRCELEAFGHRFRSTCDTEVILRGYQHWGDDILNRLNGMFGLAIWDQTRRRLLLARDPMGIKPVYYSIRDGTLWFGSEIRPIVAALGKRPEPDLVGINLFLRYRYTPAPFTALKGISKLAPGELLSVEAGKIERRRYYEYVPKPPRPIPSLEEATSTLLDLYQAAVKRHLISDVPLGLLLSGGVDSGLLLGLMSQLGEGWPTFTIGYGKDYRDDELDDAAATAALYRARHTAIRLDRDQFERSLATIVDVLEEPVTSSSIVPMYFVSQRARQDVKVALIGQGPDELLGGYKRHLGVYYGKAWRSLPDAIRAPIAALVNRSQRNEAGKRAMSALAEPDRLRRYQEVFSILPGPNIDGLFQDDAITGDVGERALECWEPLRGAMAHLDELGGFQMVELRSALPDELLMYADKLSMAHALEVRVPYLDREVVEYVQTLPATFKMRWGRGKLIHRLACRRFLPPEILARRKRGFGVNVVDDWFRASFQGNLQAYLGDPQSMMFRFLSHEAVTGLLNEHCAGRHNHYKILFSLVVLEVWLRSSR